MPTTTTDPPSWDRFFHDTSDGLFNRNGLPRAHSYNALNISSVHRPQSVYKGVIEFIVFPYYWKIILTK
ncbi:MAG: hypothetical protein ACO3MJ_05980, partial [Alphaproteobacteria bacterium]